MAAGGSAPLPAAGASDEQMVRSFQASAKAETSLLPKNFTLIDAKRVVNLLDSDLQGLEETLHRDLSLCFSFLEMHKNQCTVLPETLVSVSMLFRHLKQSSWNDGYKVSEQCIFMHSRGDLLGQQAVRKPVFPVQGHCQSVAPGCPPKLWLKKPPSQPQLLPC